MGGTRKMLRTLPDFFFGKNQSPKDSIPTAFNEDNGSISDSLCRIRWYGHSAFLLEIEGKRILIDPMPGKSSSPVSFMTRRFPYEQPIPPDSIRDIDVIILSHDHYDHLDYESIMALKERTEVFYTALGVGAHLKHWGVNENQIRELDWWDSSKLDNLTFHACPSRHFSGRGITDRNCTQWASRVIEGKHHNIYFSGDSGYGPHFKEIGEKYGPFDFAMMECGQYNEAWEAIHMMPEQSVQAGIDLNAHLLMPIHWGAFSLSIHSWTEPV